MCRPHVKEHCGIHFLFLTPDPSHPSENMQPTCMVCLLPFPPYPPASHEPMSLPCGVYSLFICCCPSFECCIFLIPGHVACKECIRRLITERFPCPTHCSETLITLKKLTTLKMEYEINSCPAYAVDAAER